MPAPDDPRPLLRAAVAAIGGVEREGQVRMAVAVDSAFVSGRHLLVQAGTGTGKSLAYLVPALSRALAQGRPAVVATATLALQGQLVDRDLPRLADALAAPLGVRPTYALVKGRSNYVCRHKIAGGFPDDDEGALLTVGAVDAGASRLGAEVVRLREWAEETESGDRDDLEPGVSDRAWRQVSVSARECLGQACPMRAECFVERTRAEAAEADIVVTNHAFLAIDAFEGRRLLPEHRLLVVDEAHELVDRVTATITEELTAPAVAAAVRKAARLADTTGLARAGELLGTALESLPEGRLRSGLPESVAVAVAAVLAEARTLQSALGSGSRASEPGGGGRAASSGGAAEGQRAVARAAVEAIFDVADRLLEARELDVAWVVQDERRGPALRVAPMSVAGLLRHALFAERHVVLTSATLELGGTFDAVAGTLGLRGEGAPAWDGLDVGSPFDYPRQAIAYVAAHLPPPGRDGTAPELVDELEALIRAAGGRTLGLFSSMRAARAAAEAMRERLGRDYPVLCQGEDQTRALVRAFAADARTCLFGTLSLWQGVDVPGPACQLVVVDRIPFPRPDDPLASARTEAIGRMGGNGFMAVSATHAALRLAQGSGRLVRSAADRGVVAFLDPRLVTARYAGFLQRSLPPYWPTTDRGLVLAALARLDESAPPLDAVPPPTAPAAGVAVPVADSVRTAVVQGRAWTAEDDEELREGASYGLDVDELAEHLGVPAAEVVRRATVLAVALTGGEAGGGAGGNAPAAPEAGDDCPSAVAG